jgi:hypothetical protein
MKGSSTREKVDLWPKYEALRRPAAPVQDASTPLSFGAVGGMRIPAGHAVGNRQMAIVLNQDTIEIFMAISG